MDSMLFLAMQNQTTIWITEGASGIGRAAATILARSGAHIIVSGRRLPELHATVAAVQQAGGTGQAVVLDVADSDDVEASQYLLALHGHVDILINNVATCVPESATTLASLRRMVDANLNGAFNCIRAVLPGMREHGGGTVINIASWAGVYVTRETETGSVSNASNHAMIAMTGSLNLEECANGIRACVISLGEVATETRADAQMTMMLQADDVARAIRFACDTPHGSAIQQIIIAPTWHRFRLITEQDF
jgi:NADP-dependent 3-hydroxy acid dehydrogenase YdfG